MSTQKSAYGYKHLRYLWMLNSRLPDNSSGPPEGLAMADVLWGLGAGDGRTLQNVDMSYSCTETTLHGGTSRSGIDLGPHYLLIFSFDI